MDKDWMLQPEEPPRPARPTLAEEQARAFEEDARRQRKPILTLRWPGTIFRN
jgi:hypothetical protein